MFKLVKGLNTFYKNVLPGLKDRFAQMAYVQNPDGLMVACSDSRVAVNHFASTEPGELLFVRNVGNIIPPFQPEQAQDVTAHSEATAIALAVDQLKVKDIIVCGHSNCAAMKAALHPESVSRILRNWVGYSSLASHLLQKGETLNPELPLVDQLSQLSVLVQLFNLQTYPNVAEAMELGALRLHAWWFDVGPGHVYNFKPEAKKFVLIDEAEGQRILEQISEVQHDHTRAAGLVGGELSRLSQAAYVEPSAPTTLKDLVRRTFYRHFCLVPMLWDLIPYVRDGLVG